MFNYTVKSLIEKLKEFPEDMPVLVDGYEGGFDNIRVISPEGVYLQNCRYSGEFESVEFLESGDERKTYMALTIDR